MPPKAVCPKANLNQLVETEAAPYVYRTKISKHLICPICMEVYLAPVRLACSHVFCNKCIGNVGGTQHLKCPMDRSTVDVNQAHFDLLVEKMLNAQMVYCKYRSNGCIWEGLRADWKLHCLQCDIKEIPDFLKKLRLNDQPKTENSNSFNPFEDEELQEKIEQEAPDIDLPTRVYLRNKPVVDQIMKENSMGISASQPATLNRDLNPGPAKKDKKKGNRKQGDRAAEDQNKATDSTTNTSNRDQSNPALKTSNSMQNLSFLEAFGENGELKIDVEEFLHMNFG